MKSLPDVFIQTVKRNFLVHSVKFAIFVLTVCLSFCFSMTGCDPFDLLPRTLPDPGNPYPPNQTRNTFRAYGISMISSHVFAKFTDDSRTFSGLGKTKQAFADCNTTLSETGSWKTSDESDFNNTFDLTVWESYAMDDAGIYNNGSPDPNVSVLFGVLNVSAYPSDAIGHTTPRTDFYPSYSEILYPRIVSAAESIFPDDPTYEACILLCNTVCHELGHARGIRGDNPSNPPCDGNNQGFCAMGNLLTNDYNPNPLFCDGHRNYIKTITW